MKLPKISMRDTIASGVMATFAVSAMMIMKAATRTLPEIHIPQTLSGFLGSSTVLTGWAIHLFIGVFVWSILYAVLAPRLPTRSYVMKGAVFGILVWLLMMFAYMPLAGAGLFGLHRGIVVPVATLVMHLVYGVVLGGMYGASVRPVGTRRSEQSQ